MSQHRKARGRATEETVAEYLRHNGFPHAERRPASLPGSDITGLPGQDVECKARRGLDLLGVMRQQRARAGDGVLPWAVVRPDGAGPATVDRWPVVLPLAQFVDLLRSAGYGDERPVAWTDPAPRVVGPVMTGQPDDPGMRCSCGAPWLTSVSHSAAVCAGPEAS